MLAVHSLSKRSNLAGARAGFYAGDPDLVRYLAEVRKHAGFMVPGPVQAAAVAAWNDDAHVDEQRERYRRRLDAMATALAKAGVDAPFPDGAFYLWAPAPDGDAWALARRLAETGGALVSPGEFYGPDGAGFVRVAVVQPDDRIALVAERLAGLTDRPRTWGSSGAPPAFVRSTGSRQRRRWTAMRRVAVTLAAIPLVLTACGDTDGDGDADLDPVAAAEQQVARAEEALDEAQSSFDEASGGVLR